MTTVKWMRTESAHGLDLQRDFTEGLVRAAVFFL